MLGCATLALRIGRTRAQMPEATVKVLLSLPANCEELCDGAERGSMMIGERLPSSSCAASTLSTLFLLRAVRCDGRYSWGKLDAGIHSQ